MEWIHTVKKADELLTKAYSEKLNLFVELSNINMKEEWYWDKVLEIKDKINDKDKEIDELTKTRTQLYNLFK